MKKTKRFTLLLIITFISGFLFSCELPGYRQAKICIFSDPHYFARELLISDGTAFQTYLAGDRKMIKESKSILESTIAMIENENPDIVLIPGDLTKDGELKSHKDFSAYLNRLEKKGIKVFAIPGNHDINNPHAMSYDGDNISAVGNITPVNFKNIYNKTGYCDAIAKDNNSLSYIVEPVPGLWIFMLDSCKYGDNKSLGYPVTSGSFSGETLNWIKKNLEKAKKKNMLAFGVMHHGILEHYAGQKLIFPEYVVDDNDKLSEELADLGLKIVFTGHYHAQDIVKKSTVKGNFIYDIETGSLVTYPCPYRVVELDGDALKVSSKHITEINYDLGGMEFQDYALSFLTDGLNNLVIYMLTSGAITIGGNPVIVPYTEAVQIAPLMTMAFTAHYAGDESPDPYTLAVIHGLMSDSDPTKQLMGSVLAGLWTDLAPADNEVVIDLKSGNIAE